ncbi:MAG TPA: PAS domain S-box protein [Tepidisphaeraceae bacterium]|jgi:PAS domain S-box-containing protein
MVDQSGSDEAGIEARLRLAAIVESSDDAIVSKTLEGIVTSWNKGAQRIFGYTAEEMVGKPITLLIPPDRQHEEPAILAKLRVGERVDHFETLRITKDGRLVEVSVTISPVKNEAGQIVGVSKIARDITEQNRVRRELQEAKEAAELASRAKDDFLSVLSHELRTPLTPVLAAVSFIEHDPALSPELREDIEMIRRNIEMQARLVDDLLDVTRISRGKVQLHFEALDAHAAIRNAVSMLQSDLDAKGLALTMMLRARDFHIWGDPGRLQQVFANILGNAIKFTPSDGSITVRSSNEGKRLRIEITDTGVGIEPDLLPRLFRPFEQGERSITRKFGGLGLGLSIVRSLVELHHGSVSAASGGTNQGATLAVEFETVAPVRGSDHMAPADAEGRKACRILLVEDHGDTREVMGRLLGSFGFVVTTAGSVREALALAERETFDLLVSDIGLPDGSGMEIMRHLKANQQIKGIALSGYGQDFDLRNSREAGFEQHLTKPVNFKILREAILKVAE